jgi:hypothetical protein
MDKTIDGKWTGGEAFMDEVLAYSRASVEYSGLVAYSFAKRHGTVVLEPLEKMASPVWKQMGLAYGWTLKGLQTGVKKIKWPSISISRLALTGERLAEIEELREMIARIDERLEYLERHGIIAGRAGGLEVRGKKLDDSKLLALRTIVLDNIDLLSEL